MNPRVSRSSALASKATGFPIAKIAARLAVGYALEEIPNDITQRTPASFEPTIDYAVVKIPRFAFEKFPFAEGGLTTQMKSVGEVMAIGRTFKQAFMKAMRSRELDAVPRAAGRHRRAARRGSSARRTTATSSCSRRSGAASSVDELHGRTADQPLVPRPVRARSSPASRTSSGTVALGAQEGPRTLGRAGRRHSRADRSPRACSPSSASVDTCARRVRGRDALLLLVLRGRGRARRPCGRGPAGQSAPSVVILGSGPNRIGQGIEFDYCCVHAAMTVREIGPRRGHGQLQPRDGLDRLRHLRPPLLRAAHRRGRARGDRRRAARGRDRRSSAARRRCGSRPT